MRGAIIAMVLNSLIFAQIGGVWVVYTTALAIHKQNKNRRLANKDNWIEYEMAADEFKRALQGEDEIVINGLLHDIVKATTHKDKIAVVVVEDHAENKLKSTLKGIQSDSAGWSDLAKKAYAFGFSGYEPARPVSAPVFNQPRVILRHSARYHGGFSKRIRVLVDHPPSDC